MSSVALDAALPRRRAEGKTTKRRLPVLPVAALLDAQSTLTAVERFARHHETSQPPAEEKYYKSLIPLSQPEPGQQYAFRVDLDRCTGCKACVTACHTQNGLGGAEVWRSTGLLHGGTPEAPAQQTVTTSCHHCVEPACMHGCPTRAYEKDPRTGIVKHLDDQCFGCQYCTLMCPYDAPKYNKALGIVRKCDMCSSRLATGEAPACVQACPNEAIAIQIVDQSASVQASEAGAFLPGAPAPEHTLPTTVYETQRQLPKNMLPADFYTTRPEHSHPPLVVMLVLTQLSVGAFCLEMFVTRLSGAPLGNPLLQSAFACALALTALLASVLHLGRPLLAWRALLGLRTSWLSREALSLGLFAKLAIVYSALAALTPLGVVELGGLSQLARPIQLCAAFSGVVGLLCSVMVYVATQRAQWSASDTGVKFFGSALLLGSSSVFAIAQLTRGASVLERGTSALLWFVLLSSVVKLAFEARRLLHTRDRRNSVHKRMATVMLGELSAVTLLRFVSGALGGLLLPLLFLHVPTSARLVPFLATAMLVLLLVGEFAERYLFFRAAPASRMPGGLK